MPQPVPYEFRDAEEIIDRLMQGKVRTDKWFAERKESLEDIVRHSVAGNTFRAFRNMRQRPSVVFRTWALEECAKAKTLGELREIRSQADYDQWLRQFSGRLGRRWNKQMRGPMPFGPMRKLPNLLLKEIVLWTGLSERHRSRLVWWLHVPLDKYTLVGIKNCTDNLEIAKSATMKFVTSQPIYNHLQVVIRKIATKAEVPAIYFDNLAWNSKH